MKRYQNACDGDILKIRLYGEDAIEYILNGGNRWEDYADPISKGGMAIVEIAIDEAVSVKEYAVVVDIDANANQALANSVPCGEYSRGEYDFALLADHLSQEDLAIFLAGNG